MIRENQKYFNMMQIILDLIVIALALIFAWIIRFETNLLGLGHSGWGFTYYMEFLILILPLFLLLYYFFGLYEPQRTRSFNSEASNIIKANFVGLLILIALLYLFDLDDYSRMMLAVFISSSFIFSLIERFTIRQSLRIIRSMGYNIKHILVIGANSLGKKFAQRIKENPSAGYNIIGFLDDHIEKNHKVMDSRVIAKIKDLEDIILTIPLDNVIIALSPQDYNIYELVSICEKHGVKTKIIPDYSIYFPPKYYKKLISNITTIFSSNPYLDMIDDIPLVDVRYVPLDNNFKNAVKRISDIVLATSAILFLSPLLIFTAIIVKISSPGPVIFKQNRVGYNRETFEMFKFRSMKEQRDDDDDKIRWTTKNDSRKTKFGSFIRKSSIDEFPQFFNVLKGDMSLIGPRPERPVFVEKFREEVPKYMIKHYVRPGMSGWAQVNGWRGNTSIKRRIEHDIYYVENWSLLLDIKIFFLTLIKGFTHKNAY